MLCLKKVEIYTIKKYLYIAYKLWFYLWLFFFVISKEICYLIQKQGILPCFCEIILHFDDLTLLYSRIRQLH